MTPRPTYVYRLQVRYPEGTEPGSGWSPDGWEPTWFTGDGDAPEWRWPAVRNYLSRATADRRARLLESYGAEVEVLRSQQVVW